MERTPASVPSAAAQRRAGIMTTAGALPKYLRVAAYVRRQITDGTLRPGQPAPSGAELSRASGFSTLTCRKALRTLIADGLLVPGPSRNARPRVANPQAAALERDLADTARALSAGLAARRHAAGLTQAELAVLARVSVTTVGHAETGRTWQSRRFWERADTALQADGELLRLHDNFRAASSPQHNQRSTPAFIERTLSSSPPAHAPAPGPASIPPLFPLASTYPPDPAQPTSDKTARSQPDPAAGWAPRPGSAQAADADSRSTEPGPAPVGPSRIVIVWTDGSVTTVHPPEVRPAPQAIVPQATILPAAIPQATAQQPPATQPNAPHAVVSPPTVNPPSPAPPAPAAQVPAPPAALDATVPEAPAPLTLVPADAVSPASVSQVRVPNNTAW